MYDTECSEHVPTTYRPPPTTYRPVYCHNWKFFTKKFSASYVFSEEENGYSRITVSLTKRETVIND